MTSSVFLTNLDDFIAPSQACVNPFVSSKRDEDKPKVSRKHGRITIEADFGGQEMDEAAQEPDLIKHRVSQDKKVATVSLNDCLACSGCVTSAEAVLIQEQSLDKFLSVLNSYTSAEDSVVVQLSPNSVASIADFLGWTVPDLFLRIATVLKRMGVKYVLDSSAGGDVAVIEAREEVLMRYKQGRSKEWTRPPTTTAESSSRIAHYDDDGSGGAGAAVGVGVGAGGIIKKYEDAPIPPAHTHLPILTSHCPGLVCYVEKTSPQALPYLSTVKSAQQIVGTVIKAILMQDEENGVDECVRAMEGLAFDRETSRRVFVVSVQPCFDKKLEASRRDFYHPSSHSQEVDLVLSTTELWQLLEMQAYKHAHAENAKEEEKAREMTSGSGKGDAASVDFHDEDHPRVTKRSRRPEQDGDASSSGVESGDDLASAGNMQVIEGPEEEQGRLRKDSLHLAFAHIFSFLDSLPADAPQGADSIEQLFRTPTPLGQQLCVHAERNMASGGYVEYLYRYLADKLYGVDLYNTPLVYKSGRGGNTDLQEVDIQAMGVGAGADNAVPPLKFCRAYGFRNIQTIMLKMKRGQCDYDFVEVMACPSGCSNGGGQLKALSSLTPHYSPVHAAPQARPETLQESRDRIAGVERTFHAHLAYRPPDASPLVQYLYQQQGGGSVGLPMSEGARRLLHTRFHAVPKLETIAPLAATKW